MSFALAKTAIYLITKGDATPVNFEQNRCEMINIIRVAVDEKVPLIQVREKQLTGRQLFELTVEAAKITRGTSTYLLVNDRADIALAAGADGVHLAANSLPVNIIRDNLPRNFIIGASTHSLEAAKKAVERGANFIVFAPVFETPGKGLGVGLSVLKGVCEELRPFPVLALGGIDETNYTEVLAAGASGFAAIRSFSDPDKLRSICAKL